MKKKGFTLIELLAVIVVLAIIALIATPIVMNLIKNAQMGAAERSADNYLKAVETLIATEKLDGTPVADGTYEIDTNGNLTFGDVEVTGTKPNGGSIVIRNGQVVKDSTTIEVGDYTVTYEDGKATATEETGPLTLASCTLEAGTANTVGAKYTCDPGDGDRVFYVLEAGTNSKPATLILEENYDTTMQAWCDQDGAYPDEPDDCQADGLTGKLNEIKEAWSKLDGSQVELPTAHQIARVDGQELDVNTSWNSPLISSQWLKGYYWTSTTRYSSGVIAVDYEHLFYDSVQHPYYGVRPVIMLSI